MKCLKSRVRNFVVTVFLGAFPALAFVGHTTRADELFFSFTDPVGRDDLDIPFGPTDLVRMDFRFDNTTGDYRIRFFADEANPFQQSFRINVNILNADTGTTAQNPSFFQDTFNDFNLAVPITELELFGTNDRLRAWQPGDRVAASGPEPLGLPDGSSRFRTAASPGDNMAVGQFTTIAPSPIPSQVIAFTEFNDPTLNTGSYTPGAAGEELGFVTTTTPSGGLSPLAGATQLEAAGRVLSHRSINATTTFGAVDLADYDDVTVSARVQVANTAYEAGDFVRVSVTNDIDTIDLVNASGSAALNNLAGDGFLDYRAFIPNTWTQATLLITSSSNSTQAAERYDFDSIEFRAIPEPVTWVLVLFATIAVVVIRRHNMGRQSCRSRTRRAATGDRAGTTWRENGAKKSATERTVTVADLSTLSNHFGGSLFLSARLDGPLDAHDLRQRAGAGSDSEAKERRPENQEQIGNRPPRSREGTAVVCEPCARESITRHARRCRILTRHTDTGREGRTWREYGA